MTSSRPSAPAHSAGLHRLAPADLPALEAAAHELGQAMYRVDLSQARNIPGCLRAFKRDLALPDWFGNNLDALYDCLTDFSWKPAPGYVIVISGSAALRQFPTTFAACSEVLASAVDAWQGRSEPFRIFFIDDGLAAQP